MTVAAGKHDRPDVAPLDDTTAVTRNPRALLRDEDGAHLRMGGDDRDRAGHERAPDLAAHVAAVEHRHTALDGDRARPRDGRAGGRVVERGSRLEHGEGDRAVHRAGVEHGQAELGRDGTRHRRLARARRTVDRDHDRRRIRHRASDPVSRPRSPPNSGYDDATARQPCTVESAINAFAAIAIAIAMRWSP